jgi:hypothetical protein
VSKTTQRTPYDLLQMAVVVKDFITTSPLRHCQSKNMTRPCRLETRCRAKFETFQYKLVLWLELHRLNITNI